MKDKRDKKVDSRTEIIHGDDLDYPLDVPAREDTATTVFPVAGTNAAGPGGAGAPVTERTSVDPVAPLPFGGDDAARPTSVHGSHRDDVPRRGTADLGLVVLRLVVGVFLGMRGLQKLFGLFGGRGVDGFSQDLAGAGFRHADIVAVVGGAVELVAAAALILGLLTPLAAAALFAVVGLGAALQIAQPGDPVLLGESERGLETAILYAGALFALLFTGPGRWSVDRRWSWSHRPRFSGFVWLIVAAAGAVLTWYLLNGSNPLGSGGDSAPVTAR